MIEMTKRVIVVLGMHRSGTSAITRGLQVLSVNLGDKLIGAIPGNNDKGFWEDAEINAFNEALLEKLDSSWHSLGPLDDQALLQEEFLSERIAALTLLKGKLSDNSVLAFKDPRVAILLPFWQAVFAELGMSASYLIAVRNPLEVAQSLLKRDNFSEVKGLMLWAKHLVGVLRGTHQQQRVFVSYEAMLDAPEEQLKRIARVLELPSPDSAPQALREYAEEFLTPGLRHNVAACGLLSDAQQVSPFIQELYLLLQQLSTDMLPVNGSEFEQRWRVLEQRFLEFVPLMAYLDSLENACDVATRECASALQQLAEFSSLRDVAVEASQGLAESHDQLLTELSSQRNLFEQLQIQHLTTEHALNKSTDEYRIAREVYEQSVIEKADLIEQLDTAREAAQKDALRFTEVLSSRFEEFTKMCVAYEQRLNDKSKLVDQISISLKVAQDEVLRLAEALDSTVKEHALMADSYEQRLNEKSLRVNQIGVDLKITQDEVSRLVDALDSRVEEHSKITESYEQRLKELEGLSDSCDHLQSRLTVLENLLLAEQSKVFDLSQQISQSNIQLALSNNELAQIISSKSWFLTKPLRFFRRSAVTKPGLLLRRIVSDSAHSLWHKLPGGAETKSRLKGKMFTALPSLFSWSRSYRNWKNFTAPIDGSEYIIPFVATLPVQTEVSAEYVPLLRREPLENKSTKLICFYLPQFHPIAENNEWWGEGFTEWSNVQPAQPQFVDHYQPHIPGELGYYSLLDTEVQRRQVELAKLYGIEGFCFYFYWFGGKRLLETPIENYLKDTSLELPFCLCWANENWSRRWDGLDSEILIDQKHSPEDDLAFIAYVAQYMCDSRYIRIDGKPLLMVYRPSLLPSAKETVERWRAWCRNNGIGEIYLAYTQSFETVDPSKYDFDAAIEFPPNNSAPPNITESVTPLRDDFGANVYDWRVFIERSQNYKKPGYTLFRGVCPAWDNTARRKSKGSILLNSSPLGYQQWLSNAIDDTCERFENSDERLIFVNAWNEWAEGAHLEPDQRYGYAYLEATRMAQVRKSLSHQTQSSECPLAIVVHAFYEDVFDEILDYLDAICSTPFMLYVTTTHEQQASVGNKLSLRGHNFKLLPVKNRGRDVLPFIKILPQLISGRHDYVIKVHTKKSTHREDGDAWRRDLFEQLLSNESISRSINIFEQNPDLGILGPTGHVVPMSFYWGANSTRTEALAARLGVDSPTLHSLDFVAGTMFMSRVSVLTPLVSLALVDEDFEVEMGQVDGTLAHAIERVISASANSVQKTVVCKEKRSVESYAYASRE